MTPDQASPQRRRQAHQAEVVHAERLTPHMIRIVLGGSGLAEFTVSGEHTDHYVKLLFPPLGAAYTHPFDPDDVQRRHSRNHWPVTRTYTVRSWDHQRHELTIDVVVHGDDGLAGPWAQSAVHGTPISFYGPGGGYVPDQGAGWHLFVGDESALPAIAVSLERLPPEATPMVFLEVENPEEQQALVLPAGAVVSWVSRNSADVAPGSELLEALRTAAFPAGSVDAFVHGEAGMVKAVRSHLRFERGVERAALSASGYWRRGCTDEGWRAVKGQWKAAIDDEEASESALAR